MTDTGREEPEERETHHSNPIALQALDRMARAHKRGTGCHLTAEMVRALGFTFLAEIWDDDEDATP